MGSRKTIDIDPVRHAAPIPMAAVVRGVVMTSAIMGADPATGQLAESVEDQARFAFENLRRVMETAGGSLDDVLHVTVFVKDFAFRRAVNESWLALFPDEHDRPARHTVKADLPGAMLVQLEAVGALEG